MKFVNKHGGISLFTQYDFVMLNETFQLLDSTIPGLYCFEELAVKGETGRPMGGILVAVKPHLSPKIKKQTKYYVAVETRAFTLVCFYFNPLSEVIVLVEEIAEVLCTVDLRKPCLFCGDFNARVDLDGEEKAEALIDLMKDFGFSLITDKKVPTYVCPNGASTIDLVFANFPNVSTANLNNEVALLRKHTPVEISCDLSTSDGMHEEPEKIKRKRIVGVIDSTDIEIAYDIATTGDIDVLYDKLRSSILSVVPIIHPKVKSTKKSFSCPEIRKLKFQLLSLRGKLNRSPGLFQTYARERKRYKDLVCAAKQRAIEEEENRKVAEAETLPWKLNPKRNGSVACRIHLDEWSPHFSKLYNPIGEVMLPGSLQEHDYALNCNTNLEQEWFLDSEETQELNREISEEEASRTLFQCADKKAVGPDLLANEHLKGSFPLLGTLWVLLFNIILSTGQIVECWRQSTVKVLYKGKGDIRNPNSYRGIALLSHPYKWFTKILAQRIYTFVDGDTLPDEQYGYRRGRSTVEAFLVLKNYVKECLQKPKCPVYAVFVDFSKCFDTIHRGKLVRKLALLHGVRGRILRVIATMLTCNLLRVFDGVSYSDEILQARGLQQGESLSPLLYICFVSDLPSFLRDVFSILRVIMFADDLVFFCTSEQAVQSGLDLLNEYCNSHFLKVNLEKTRVLVFRKGGARKNVVFRFGEDVVPYCNEYEYLGITVQCNWTFTKHLKKRRAKAAAASFCIPGLRSLSLDGAVKYFNVMIEPILTYGIVGFWDDLSVKQLEFLDKCYCDFLKKVFCLPRNVQNRKVILMSDLPTLVESLVIRGTVPSTTAYVKYLEELENKLADIDDEFFRSPVMVQNDWKTGKNEKRHLSTRLSCHGFHFKLCTIKKCNNPSTGCFCKLCNAPCPLLHALECPKITNLAMIDEMD